MSHLNGGFKVFQSSDITHQQFADLSQVTEETGRQGHNEQTGSCGGNFILQDGGQKCPSQGLTGCHQRLQWSAGPGGTTSTQCSEFCIMLIVTLCFLLAACVQSFMTDLSVFMVASSIIFTFTLKTKPLNSCARAWEQERSRDLRQVASTFKFGCVEMNLIHLTLALAKSGEP